MTTNYFTKIPFLFKDSNATKANFSSKEIFFLDFFLLNKAFKNQKTNLYKSMTIKSKLLHSKVNLREMHLKNKSNEAKAYQV